MITLDQVRWEYTPNGVTVSFAYLNKALAAADVVPTLYDAAGDELALPGYTITGVGQDAGGNVVFDAAPSGSKLVIDLVTEAMSNIATDDFNAETAAERQAAWERGVLLGLQARVGLDRALRMAGYDSGAFNPLPPKALLANALLGFDAQGQPMAAAGLSAVTISTAMTPVVQAATLAVARAALGLDATYLAKAGGTLTGVLNLQAASFNQAKGANLASVAGTTNIWTQTDGDLIHITGTNLITSFGTAPQAGAVRRIVADGAFGLAQGANLDLPFGGASITVSIGDRFTVIANTTTAMIVTDYVKADGTPLRMSNTGVRQSVQAGPVDANGLPSFLPSTSVNLNLSTQNITASAPFVVSSANNSGASGPNDRIAVALSNFAFNGLTASRAAATPNFLFVDVAANGALTPGFGLLAPIYQWGGVPSTVNGQFTFNIAEMKGYVGNGTVAVQTNRVYVGEAATDGTGVISTVAYAYNGRYESAFTATLPAGNVNVSANHNIGVKPKSVNFLMECTTADGGFAVGHLIDRGDTFGFVGGTTVLPMAIYRDTKVLGSHTANTAPFQAINQSTGAAFNLTAASWKWKWTAERGW